MPIKGKVQFKVGDGAVTVEIASGFASLGEFVLCYAKKGETNFIEFGDNPKRIDDAKRDIIQIPLQASELQNYVLAINGKYGPAPGHTQVKVKYIFRQNSIKLTVDPESSSSLEETTEEPFKRYSHFFEFIERA